MIQPGLQTEYVVLSALLSRVSASDFWNLWGGQGLVTQFFLLGILA